MRLSSVLFALLLSFTPALAQTPDTNAAPAPAAAEVTPSEVKSAEGNNYPPPPAAVPGGVNIHWYGHGFIYLTSSVGVRAAIDPFGPNTVHYKFPPHLVADFVLVSHEAEDHANADQIFGNPLIFRSVTAVGLNRANGIPFHGIALQKDQTNGYSGANTAFTISFDGIAFCYLGQINQPLLSQEKEQIGHADVLFLPVGLVALSPAELDQIVADTGASVVIPINYKTDYSGDVSLRPLDEYLSQTKLPVHKVDSEEMAITRSTLPSAPTLYVLKVPPQQ